MENTQIYIYAFLGILLVILLGIISLQKATPELTLGDTILQYFKINLLPIIASMVLTFAVIGFSSGEDAGILHTLGINVVTSKGAGFTIGLMSQFLLNRIIPLITSTVPEIKTSGTKVETT